MSEEADSPPSGFLIPLVDDLRHVLHSIAGDVEDLAGETDVQNNGASTLSAGKADCRVVFCIIVQFVGTMALCPIPFGMSACLASEGIGSAVLAGLMVSTCNQAGVLINLILSPPLKKPGHHVLWVMHVLFAMAMAVVVFLPHVPAVMIGAVLDGLSACR